MRSNESLANQLAIQDTTISKLIDANLTQTQALTQLRDICIQLNERCDILHQAIKTLSDIVNAEAGRH